MSQSALLMASKTKEGSLAVLETKVSLTAWKLPTVYEKEQVDLFWSQTDKKTHDAVRETADPALQDKEFRSRITKRLTKTEREFLSSQPYDKLEELMRYYLGQAQSQQEKHHTDKKWIKKAGRRTTEFLTNFQGYIEAYSGIIQIMNGAGPFGQGYGDVAYGALSLLLVVAVNKKQTEDYIDSMLLTLQQQFRRINMLEHVYSNPSMKEHFAVVYRLGVEFLREAALYYSIGTHKRLWHVLIRPPSVDIETKVSGIKSAIEEMTREMETFDRIRLKGVEVSIEAIHIRSDNERLEALRGMLKVEDHDSDTFLQDYDKRLSEIFNFPSRLPPFDVDKDLFQNKVFQNWKSCSHSALLVLQGDTVAPYLTGFSWISPAAVSIIRRLDNQLLGTNQGDTTALAYFCCPVVEAYEDQSAHKISANAVLSALIYQLLKTKNAQPALRDESRYSKLKHDIESISPTVGSTLADQRLRLRSILVDLLTTLAFPEVCIVLDRVDRISGSLDHLMDPLLDLVEGDKCVLKLLIVAPSIDPSIFSDKVSQKRFMRLVFDQGSLNIQST